VGPWIELLHFLIKFLGLFISRLGSIWPKVELQILEYVRDIKEMQERQSKCGTFRRAMIEDVGRGFRRHGEVLAS
jgi:hypothetical protein